ncbi:hypothetical protein JCM10207_001576 [Rhodosporidiobolus poonsookiae]
MPVPTHHLLSTAPAIDRAIASATADPYNGVPRLVFLAATSSTPVLYAGKGGYARLPPFPASHSQGEGAVPGADDAEPISEDSVFELYSCTKLVGTLTALQLVEQGKIALDDDASLYVPQLREARIFEGFDEEGEPILKENTTPITVRMLITHTSGFVYYFHDLEAHDKLAAKLDIGVAVYGEKANADWLYKMPLFAKPGSWFKYGTSIDWLTRVVENVSGLDLESYVQKNIFGPLGITDISYNVNPAQIDMAFAKLENEVPVGPYEFRLPDRMSTKHRYGGAGLKGPASSYLKLIRALLRGGELDGARILRPETVEMMFEPQLDAHQARMLQDAEWKGSEPFSRRKGKSLEDANWGLGGMLCGTGLASGRSAGSLHWSGMANTFWVIDRKKDVCFVVFSNIIPYANDRVFDAWEIIETQLYKGLA